MTSHKLTSHASKPHTRAATVTRRLAVALAAQLIGLVVMPAHAEEVASYEVVAQEGRLFPRVLNVPAGVKLRLTLRNEGKTAIEFENLVLRVEKIVAPDSAATVTVQPLKPGSYVFVDDFHTETAKLQVVAK